MSEHLPDFGTQWHRRALERPRVEAAPIVSPADILAVLDLDVTLPNGSDLDLAMWFLGILPVNTIETPLIDWWGGL